MLRAIIKLAMIGAGAGLLASQLDLPALQKIESAMRDIGSMLRQSGLPGNQETAAGVEKAADVVRSAAQDRIKTDPKNGATSQEQAVHQKAFYNRLEEECHWEKIIDPSTGTVSCAVPDRRGQRR